MADHVPSIRIEHELGDGKEPTPKHEPPAGSSNFKGMLLVSLMAVVAVGIALLALRPDAGQAADGSVREVPTTTTEPVATTTTQPRPPLVAEIIEVEDVESRIREVAAAEIGFLGVLDSSTLAATPPIVRSVNGVTWNVIEAEVVEPFDPTLLRPQFATFVGLRSDSDQFTILRVRQALAALSRVNTGSFVIDRLMSTDGARWRPDESFSSIIVGQAMPSTTGSGDLLLSTSGMMPDTSGVAVLADRAPETHDELLADEAIDDPGAESNARLSSCGAEFLMEFAASTAPSEFRFIGPAGATDTFSATGLLTSPQLLPGSSQIAALTRQRPALPAGCELPGVSLGAQPVSIQVWAEAGQGESVQLTNLAEAGVSESELATAVALGPTGDGLLIATVDNLVRIDLDGTVNQLVDIGSIDIRGGVPTAVPASDGVSVVDVRNGIFRRWAITDTETIVNEEPVFEQSGFGQVIYADANVLMLASAQSADRTIRLAP